MPLGYTPDYQHTNGHGASNPGAPWSPLSPLTPLLPFLPLSPCEQQRIKKDKNSSPPLKATQESNACFALFDLSGSSEMKATVTLYKHYVYISLFILFTVG